MKNPLSKTPFLFLLIPLIAGILLQYYFHIEHWSILFFLLGSGVMLLSYFIPVDKQFRLRWLFGSGACLFVIGIAIVTTELCQERSSFVFDNEVNVYRGVVIDTPQDKPKTIAYKVELPNEGKLIVCYVQRDSLQHHQLNIGDEFLFRGKIQPFRNIGNSEFDYVGYMYNKGFVGSVYVSKQSWKTTGNVSSSLTTIALHCRRHILDFYQSLGLNQTEYSILSALTLGYQDALSDDLVESFRTTGTVHVLSVSGLHVGIIYMMISFFLGFIRRSAKYYWVKPLVIILLLWIYAFITGLPTSVIRASVMLTVFCFSEIFDRRSLSMHALYIAAFFMLLVNPFAFFDVGFQLSFMSVFAILYLQPKLSRAFVIKNKYLRYLWEMFALSLVAQLGTFPLCLYYFGTFPTYFFAANLVIVPLVSLITYSAAGIFVAKVLSTILPSLSAYLYYLPVKFLQLLVEAMTLCISFFEHLPFALIQDARISFADLCLIFFIIVAFLVFLIYKKSKALIVSLLSILILLSMHLYGNLF